MLISSLSFHGSILREKEFSETSQHSPTVMDAAMMAALSILDNTASLKEEQRKEKKKERKL